MFFSQQTFLSEIENELNIVLDGVAEIIIDKWREGGHSLTGAFESDLRKEVRTVGNTIIANIWLNDYYQFVNEGVDADRIPFNPGSGADKSAYIQGLILYFQLRKSMSQKEAMAAAFATAHKHLRVGMPTDRSKLGFFSSAMDEAETIIDQGMEAAFGDAMNKVIEVYQSQLVGDIRIIL